MRALLAATAALLAGCTSAAKDDCGCDYPAHCEAGTCTLDCAADADCGDATLLCAGGTCTSRCRGVLCNDGHYCEARSGDCVPDPDRACRSDADCGDETLLCDEGVCTSRCARARCDGAAGEICDPRTGECAGGRGCDVTADCARLGRDLVCEDGLCAGGRLAACSVERPCAGGLSCTGARYRFCAAPCEAGCRTSERCAGEGAYDGYCVPNLCRPGGGPLGLYQDTAFMAPCDAVASGDGLCFGPLPGGDGPLGICFARGTAASGSPCRADAAPGSAQACASAICAGAEETGVGTCLDGCSLFDGISCPPLDGKPAACFPALGEHGVCAPRSDPPVAPGESCQPAEFLLPCEEDHACLPVPLGMTCQPLCALAAASGDPGACASGTCTQVARDNAVIGACREAP